MKIDFSSQTLNISHNGDILFSHQPGLPAFFLGKGMEKMEIYRGNFDIEDYVESRVALTHVRSAGDHVFTFAPCANTAALLQMTVVISADDEDVSLQFSLLEGTTTASGCVCLLKSKSTSGAAVSRCPTLICVDAISRCGLQSLGLAVIHTVKSNGKRM